MLTNRERFQGDDLCIGPQITTDGLLKQQGKVIVLVFLKKFVWHIEHYTTFRCALRFPWLTSPFSHSATWSAQPG